MTERQRMTGVRRNGRTLVAYFVASRSFPFLSRLTPHYPHLTPTSRLTRLRRLPPGGSETGGGKVRVGMWVDGKRHASRLHPSFSRSVRSRR